MSLNFNLTYSYIEIQYASNFGEMAQTDHIISPFLVCQVFNGLDLTCGNNQMAHFLICQMIMQTFLFSSNLLCLFHLIVIVGCLNPWHMQLINNSRRSPFCTRSVISVVLDWKRMIKKLSRLLTNQPIASYTDSPHWTIYFTNIIFTLDLLDPNKILKSLQMTIVS